MSLAPEYMPSQDRHRPYSPGPPRYRYAGSPELPHGHGPPPVYVDEYGYEIIRVPREARPVRGPAAPVRYYEAHEDEHVPYTPYEYRASRRDDGFRGGYMYYEDVGGSRGGLPPPPPPPSGRRSAFDSEGGFEGPVDVKMEDVGVHTMPGDV